VNFVSILVLFNASISLCIKKRIGLIQQQFNQREFQKNTNTQLDFLVVVVVVVVGFYWLWLLPYSQVYFGRIQIRILGKFLCTDHAVQDMFEHSGSTKA
jgi:hypothetical protein